jgi:hypothetical protein
MADRKRVRVSVALAAAAGGTTSTGRVAHAATDRAFAHWRLMTAPAAIPSAEALLGHPGSHKDKAHGNTRR